MHGKNTVRVGKPSIGMPTPPEATLEMMLRQHKYQPLYLPKPEDVSKLKICQKYFGAKSK
jgi:hypothetical protein